VKPVLAAMKDIDVKGMAHITGGGLLENVHRMFPDALAARIDRACWPRPPIFDWLQRAGNVGDEEMHRVFNCGIGMVVVVAAAEAERAQALLTEGRRDGVPDRRRRPSCAGRAGHGRRLAAVLDTSA
jgi:phosphoribosylformylglycinamidine cyclo-ligase